MENGYSVIWNSIYMKYNILMDEISNTSKYSTKNKQIIDNDIITHSFKEKILIYNRKYINWYSNSY